MIEWQSRTVDGLRARSCSIHRMYSAAASAKVAPVRTMPGSVPRRASSSRSRSHASAVRFVK
jgi:hypothetical protein